MIQVLIARHGNTFQPHDEPRRIGAKTDLPLVEHEKARAIGHFLKGHFKPTIVYCSPLLRTHQTATIALETAQLSTPIQLDNRFIEIDYGMDENAKECEVIQRLGEKALLDWNQNAVVPNGWQLDVEKARQTWQTFFQELVTHDKQQLLQKSALRVLVVTSNGIVRFAPSVLGTAPSPITSLKIKTGALSLFTFNEQWRCQYWNTKPQAAAQFHELNLVDA